MKAMFLGLLLANVLYFGYQRWISPQEPSAGMPMQDAEVSTLELASERPELTRAELDVPSVSSDGDDFPVKEAPTTGLLTNVKRCVSLGPFRELADAVQAQAVLAEDGHTPRQRLAKGQLWAGYWVHLPPAQSRSEAEQSLTRLRDFGVADSYIVPTGQSRNAISLGVFSELSRAQHRANEIRSFGYEPTIADRHRTGTVYWVDVELDNSGFVDPAQFQTEPGRIVRLEVKACPQDG